ncbi:MAG TPA: DUF1232 domain-containing protein [Candidatus Dojkabacteria bacterium]|nr:DUF1232 domain-containing protein [Candidatus Dojkabacteria bacterium]HNW23527.1 DUF1232 domain-containing protein [Candidatus Dojkabacteria bacterium]
MKDFFKRYWLFILAIIYIFIPTDLIPDVLPLLGGLDDSTLVILGLIREYIINKKKSGV